MRGRRPHSLFAVAVVIGEVDLVVDPLVFCFRLLMSVLVDR
jgi:hypothetical protein